MLILMKIYSLYCTRVRLERGDLIARDPDLLKDGKKALFIFKQEIKYLYPMIVFWNLNYQGN